MGLLDWLRKAAEPPAPPRREPAHDHVSVKVTGEATYQDNLRRLTGRRGQEAVEVEHLMAVLIREPDNPHDPNAIRVDIEGLTVGYVSRGNARKYAKRLDRALEEGWEPVVPTWIGCHGDGNENPNIGLRLRFARNGPLERRGS